MRSINWYDQYPSPFRGFWQTPYLRYPERYRGPVRLRDSLQAYYLDFWLPGVRKQDIRLKVVDGCLELEGTGERRYGWWGPGRAAFHRSIVLPPDADHSRINARYLGGRLRVQIMKQGASEGSQGMPDDFWRSMENGFAHAFVYIKRGWNQMLHVLKHGL